MKKQLADLGLILPEVAQAAANYVPYLIEGNHLYISGQIPMINGELTGVGKIGRELTVKQGKVIARDCTLNILAQVDEAIKGDWDRVKQVIRLGVFVHSSPDFIDQSIVANGASDLIVAVLGERGKHIRAAIGCSQLPFGVAVEVEASLLLHG